MAGYLTVTLLYAAGLKDKDWFGKQDPYCKLSIGAQTYRSKTHTDGGKNPVWNQTFKFNVVHENTLFIEIWDQDSMSRDDLVGRATVDLAAVRSSRSLHVNVPVQTTKGKQHGTIHLDLGFEPNAAAMAAPTKPAAMAAGPSHAPAPAGPYPAAPAGPYAAAPAGYPGAPSHGSYSHAAPGYPAGAPPAGYPAAPAAPAGYPAAPPGYPAPPPGYPSAHPPAYPSGHSAPAGYPPAYYGAPAGYPAAHGHSYPAGYHPHKPHKPHKPHYGGGGGGGMAMGLLGGAAAGLLLGDMLDFD